MLLIKAADSTDANSLAKNSTRWPRLPRVHVCK